MERPRGRRFLASLVLVVLVAGLAGCAALSDGGDGTDTPVPTTTAPQPTPTTATTPSVDPDNPFGERTLTVAIAHPPDDPYKQTVVREALAYWEEHSERYAGYPIEYRVVDDPAAARLTVEFVSEPITCDGSTEEFLVGCAPLNRDTAPETSDVRVGRNYSASYTHDVVVHELGHTLGLDHDDDPQRYMRPRLPSGVRRDTVHVYVTGTHGVATPAQREEVRTALDYYADHPDLNESQQLNWTRVESVDEADFVVEFTEDDPDCFGTDGGSCPGTPKYDDQLKLVLDDLDTEVTAWHVAFHLAPTFFGDEVPEVLQSDASRTERENWDG